MKKRILSLTILVFILLVIPISALAQTYRFSLDREVVHAYWQEDGTLALDYFFVFTNSPSASPLDFVDVGLPTQQYSLKNTSAEVNGEPISHIEQSSYVDGIEVGLGAKAIQPGDTGTVHVMIWGIEGVLHTDSQDSDYASAVFSPTWFGTDYVSGNTNMEVNFHLPPGVEPDEPRWHSSPSGGWPEQPETSLDDQGRVTYTWRNPDANGHTQYKFGASFPKTYVPESAIHSPGILERLGIDKDTLMGFMCCSGVFGFLAFIIWASVASSRKRKMKYLPPKIRIEGHGIKRGLTAVEAAVLMEHPPDKIMTMILFAVLKKELARVVSRDPLKLEVEEPIKDGLHTYEREFLEAFTEKSARARKKKLQEMMVDLIKSVGKKMKGFSHKETLAYYKNIMKKAWQQVEAADTPEVKSQKFDEHMGWTMLDRDFDDRTRDVFRTGPVFVPMWWGRYDPTWRRSTSTTRTSRPAPSTTGGGRSAPSMPNLPGGAFAASMVGGMQNFASDVVGNVTSFASGITEQTNPIPKSSGGSFSGSSGGCACACACAGCACACAGGGR